MSFWFGRMWSSSRVIFRDFCKGKKFFLGLGFGFVWIVYYFLFWGLRSVGFRVVVGGRVKGSEVGYGR